MGGNDGSLNFDTKIDSSGFQKGIEGLGGVAAKGLSLTGKILAGTAGAVTAIGGAAIKVGSDFEAGMSQVQAVSGASGESLQQLKEKAKEMGAKTKFSATEAAEAMNYMAMAGWKTEDMLNGIEGVMNLAAASGEDLATTSDIVTDAMTAFGLAADGTSQVMENGILKDVPNATHFADILAAASSNANTNVGLMGETFKYVAPLAGSLGYSAEDTAMAIGLMANAGVKGSQAGTSLRSVMTRLAKPTKESQAAMDALGLSITDSSGQMKPLSVVVEEMRRGFSGLTEEEKATYAAMLGGQEAMSGLLAIVNASDKDFEKLSGAINNCNGSAAEMAEIMQDNLQGQITILQSGLEGLGISIYETMQGTAKDVVKEAQGMVQQLQEAFNQGGLEGLVTAFGNVLAQVVQRIAEAAPMVVVAAVNLVTSFCEGLRNAQGLGEAGASLIGSLIGGILSCMGEISSTAVVLFAQLLAGLAQELPRIIETGKEAVGKFVNALSDNAPSILESAGTIISTLFQAMMDALPEITRAGVEALDRLAQGISENLPSLIPVAMEALVKLSGSLRENAGLLVDAGLNLIKALADALIDNLPVFIETVPTIVTNIAGIINDNAPKLIAVGLELIGKLAAGLIEAIPTLVANIPEIIAAIVLVFTAFNWLSLGKDIITAIADGVKSLAESLPNVLREIGNRAKEWMRGIDWHALGTDLIGRIGAGVQSLVTAIPDKLRAIGHTAMEFFKGIDWLSLGTALVSGIVNGITGGVGGLWTAVKDLCSGILDKIKSFFGINSPSTVMAEQGDYLVQGLINGVSGMPAELAVYLEKTLQKVTAWGKQMLGDVKDSAKKVVDSAVSLISELPGKVWPWLVNTVTKATMWGQMMLSAAKTAISNTISAVISLISELPGKVWAWLDNTLTKVKLWGQMMLSAAKMVLNNTISAIVGLLSELPGKVWAWLDNTIQKVKLWGTAMLSAARVAVGDLIENVVSAFMELPDKIWSWLEDTVTKITMWGTAMLSAAKMAASNAVTSVASQFTELPGKVWLWLENAVAKVALWGTMMLSAARVAVGNMFSIVDSVLSGLPSKMMEIGGNIINGIWNGIANGWNWLMNQVANLASNLLAVAKRALGIQSPSKKFRDEFGRWLMPGAIEGVEKSMPKALRDMKAQAGELLAAMQGTVDASMGEVSLNATGFGDARGMASAGTVIYNDNHQEQENNYHVPVVSPAETAKANREAFRRMAGGVK